MSKTSLFNIKSKIAFFIVALAIIIGVGAFSPNTIAKAADLKYIHSNYADLVIGSKAKIYNVWTGNVTYKSTNKKVLTVTKDGVVTAKRLGEAKIVVNSKVGGREVYEISVSPKNEADIWFFEKGETSETYSCDLNESIKLVAKSNKYDLSQIKWHYKTRNSDKSSLKSNVYKRTNSKGLKEECITCWYGEFEREIWFTLNDTADTTTVQETTYSLSEDDDEDEGAPYEIKGNAIERLNKYGIKVIYNGAELTDYDPSLFGDLDYTLTIVSDGKEYSFTNEKLRFENLLGRLSGKHAETMKKVIAIVDGLNLQGKSDREKVGVITQYMCDNLTYGDDEHRSQDISYSLEHGIAVCEGYSNLFFFMASAAGLDAKIVYSEEEGNHAFNRVKVDGTWYYIDVTWCDYLNGGSNSQYYLSESSWSDKEHIVAAEGGISELGYSYLKDMLYR